MSSLSIVTLNRFRCPIVQCVTNRLILLKDPRSQAEPCKHLKAPLNPSKKLIISRNKGTPHLYWFISTRLSWIGNFCIFTTHFSKTFLKELLLKQQAKRDYCDNLALLRPSLCGVKWLKMAAYFGRRIMRPRGTVKHD